MHFHKIFTYKVNLLSNKKYKDWNLPDGFWENENDQFLQKIYMRDNVPSNFFRHVRENFWGVSF